MAAKVTTTRLALLALSSAILGAIPGVTPGSANAAAPAEERFTPAPPPSVALPRLTPLDAPLGNVALKPYPAAPPQVAPPLSPVRTPGAPPKAPTVKPTASAKPPNPPPSNPPVAVKTDVPPVVRPAEPATSASPAPAPVAEPSAPPAEATPASGSAPAPVEPSPSETAKAAPPSPAKAADRRAVVTTAGVYLRAAPNSKGRVIDALDRGQKLEAMGAASDGWVQVGRKGKSIGYVAADYLTDAQPAKQPASGDAPAAASTIPSSYAKASRDNRGCALPDDLSPFKQRTTLPVGSRARVTADANLRVAPVCDAKVLDVLDAGERVTIQGVSGSWYRVARRNRMIGYVGAALLTAKSER
jgi:uncharacterized protein YgiM (DUF1202 family)